MKIQKDIPKFVLEDEIKNKDNNITLLKDLILLIWKRVNEVSTDKNLEHIKRIIHTDLMNHNISLSLFVWENLEDWIWEVLFKEKEKTEEIIKWKTLLNV